MIKSITNFLIIFFIFQQLKSQISQIDQNGYNAFLRLNSSNVRGSRGNNKIIILQSPNKKGGILHVVSVQSISVGI